MADVVINMPEQYQLLPHFTHFYTVLHVNVNSFAACYCTVVV